MAGKWDNLAQVLTTYRTSTPIRSGLNSHMIKSNWCTIPEDQNLIHSETKSCVQSEWIVSVHLELTNYKKFT